MHVREVRRFKENVLENHLLKYCRYIMEGLLSNCLDNMRIAAAGWRADSCGPGRPQQRGLSDQVSSGEAHM